MEKKYPENSTQLTGSISDNSNKTDAKFTVDLDLENETEEELTVKIMQKILEIGLASESPFKDIVPCEYQLVSDRKDKNFVFLMCPHYGMYVKVNTPTYVVKLEPYDTNKTLCAINNVAYVVPNNLIKEVYH